MISHSKIYEMMELIDAEQKNMSEGTYLKLCNKLKEIKDNLELSSPITFRELILNFLISRYLQYITEDNHRPN